MLIIICLQIDLLWLELQAWISDRTPREQDSYLYVQRKRIPHILNQIMEYRFQPYYSSKVSNEPSDSSQSNGAYSLYGTVLFILVLVLYVYKFFLNLNIYV